MPLSNVGANLESELDAYADYLRKFAASRTISASSDFSLSDEYLLEGLLSRIWQCWCRFCRSCVIESCLGTTSSSGKPVFAVAGALSAEHVSGAAIAAKNRRAGTLWSSPNQLLWREPTWGDIDVLVKIVGRLAPSNSANLLAGFSSGHSRAKALQLIRNASAHNNHQNMADIMMLRPSYIVFPINHPVHALFWTEPKSKDFLVMDALDELRSAAKLAIA